MGVSTDAILAFGFDLGEELPESLMGDNEHFDFDEWFESQVFDVSPPDHEDYQRDWPEYWQAKRSAIAALPYEVITHCSYDYPMYFLAARGSDTRAKRGYPAGVSTPDVAPATIEAMRKFCDDYGIQWERPRWMIFSLWG